MLNNNFFNNQYIRRDYKKFLIDSGKLRNSFRVNRQIFSIYHKDLKLVSILKIKLCYTHDYIFRLNWKVLID